MAQSRMAGMAMDLGPDDLADVGEAATLATNKMGMEQGKQASIMFDLRNQKEYVANDGDRNVYIRGRGGDIKKTVPTLTKLIEKNFTSTNNAGYPVGDAGFGYEGTHSMNFGRQKVFQDMYNDSGATY